jgi:hypothetical protein
MHGAQLQHCAMNRFLKIEMHQSIASCVLNVRSIADVKSSKVALKLFSPRVDSITHESVLPLLIISISNPGGKGMLSGDTDSSTLTACVSLVKLMIKLILIMSGYSQGNIGHLQLFSVHLAMLFPAEES